VRILLTWELGLNLGHLTRLLPVAQELKRQGHIVLVASRDIQAAATVLGPSGIPFIQAPHLPWGIPLSHRATGYADILLSQGWSDQSALWGLTQAWLNIIKLFRPDKLVLDYSPTVSLAARIARIPTILVGNGFELPPLTDPLPPFPNFSWATYERVASSEKLAVAQANSVLKVFKQPTMTAIRDLFQNAIRLFATFQDLDHYGDRGGEEYIGPLLGKLNAPCAEWPEASGMKIFACLRPDTNQVEEILGALSLITARVVCVASGFTAQQLHPFKKKHIQFSSGPVHLESLFDADLCVTYGAEGTMLRFLLAGVPQLISPWHVEAHMSARQIEAHGLGIALRERSSKESIVESIAAAARVVHRTRLFAKGAAAFAKTPAHLVLMAMQGKRDRLRA
jgi:UDP:flavonoid glycosyltransferase YjiC (YdhE family)